MDYRKMKIEYVRYYNAGTEAYKLEPSQPEHPNRPVRKRTHKAALQSVKTVELAVDPLAMIAICLTVVMVVLMCIGFSRLRAAEADLEQMEKYVEILETDVEKESARLEEELDLEALRKAAVSLGLVPIEEVDHLRITMDTPAD